MVRPSSCIVKGGILSSRRYLPTYLPTYLLMDESSILITAPPSITFRDITLAAAILGETSDIKNHNTKSANLHHLQRFEALYSHKHSVVIAHNQTNGAISFTQGTKLNLELKNHLITKHCTNDPHLANHSEFNIITALGHLLGLHSERNNKWTSHQPRKEYLKPNS